MSNVGWIVPVEDLERLRQGLQAVLTFHEATDIANAMKNLSPEANPSPITAEVGDLLEMVRDHLKDFKFAEYEEEQEQVGTLRGAESEIEIDLTDEDDEEIAPEEFFEGQLPGDLTV